jgi:hypothetical protein
MRLPSFEEEPHTSPAKLGELGIHVLLSPKKQNTRNEQIDHLLSFPENSSRLGPKTEEEDEPLEYWDRARESMYVTAFNTSVDTVIEREGHLFSQEEMDVINIYRNLPCIYSCTICLICR